LRFETADSQGQIFNSNIKTNPFEKQDKVDVKVILEELTRVELEETNQLKKELIDSMNSVSIIFESTGEVDRQLLKEVEMNIKLFKGEAINE